MKAKVTKQEVVNTQAAIVGLLNRNEKYPAKFNYALLKNYKRLVPEVEAIQKTQKSTLNVFNSAIRAMQKSIKERAEKEKMKAEDKQALIDKEVKALSEDEKHKKALDESKVFMESKEEFDFYIVPIEHVPSIESNLFMKLEHIIKAD